MNNQNIKRIKFAVDAVYKQLEELNDAIDNALNDNTIDSRIRNVLDCYYKELSDTELLDEIMDLIIEDEE